MKKKIVRDPKGQWAHPGEITQIPSGNITMQGVNYPVMGVDNMGNHQMMYPNQDYQFPGNSVTEYPMMNSDELDEMRYGGPYMGKLKRPKGTTHKNIKSSINFLLARNEMLFGHSGNRIYDPSMKGGGEPPINIDRSKYSQIINKPFVGASGYDVFGTNHDNMVNLGYKRISGTGASSVYTKDGHYLVMHSSGKGYVDIGDMRESDGGTRVLDPKMNQPVAPISTTPKVPGKPVQFGAYQNYNPNTGVYTDPVTGKPIQPIVQSFKMGGNKEDCGCSKMEYGGDCDKFVPGQTDDSFLAKKKMDFLQYLTKNNMQAIATEEANRVDGIIKKYGGEKEFIKGFYELPVYLFQYGGENQPEYLPMKQAYLPTTNPDEQELIPPSNFEQSQVNPNQVTGSTYFPMNFRGGRPDTEATVNWGMAGANFITSIANSIQDREAKKRMKSLQGADNQFYTTPAGDRGDYDINSGAFRPNDMVPVQFSGQNYGSKGSNYRFQEGGEYDLSEDEIAEILKNGGQIEYIH